MASPSEAKFRAQFDSLLDNGSGVAAQLLSIGLRPLLIKRIIFTCLSLLLITSISYSAYFVSRNSWSQSPDAEAGYILPESAFDYERRGVFQPLRVKGFDNTGVPGGDYFGQNLACYSLAHTGEIGVQKAFFNHEDPITYAKQLDSHPMVDYTPHFTKLGSDSISLAKLFDLSWDRIATACVWMSNHGVYFCVSRIIFHSKSRKDTRKISFLRGEIYNQGWVHQEKYRLKWKSREIVFPKIFETETEYTSEDHEYGPEDARVVIEEGVEEAEPVVIFNMMTSRSDWKRAMWMIRPFSEQVRILTIRGTERPEFEKNWTPFFVRELDKGANSTATAMQQPNTYIHFIHWFEPLTVLKCHIHSGICKIQFKQEVQKSLISKHGDEYGKLRGGTQLVPIPLSNRQTESMGLVGSPNLQAFAAFPRSNVEISSLCKSAIYRPEIIVLVTNTTHFYLGYGSEAMDFGPGIVMDADELADPCKNRIIITNSIARWDFNAQTTLGERTDVMTLTLTRDDTKVQVLQLSGVWNLIRSLPSLAGFFAQTEQNGKHGHRLKSTTTTVFPALPNAEDPELSKSLDSIDPFDRANAVAWDIRACLEQSAVIDFEIRAEKLEATRK